MPQNRLPISATYWNGREAAPTGPKDFVVTKVADGFDNPRWMYIVALLIQTRLDPAKGEKIDLPAGKGNRHWTRNIIVKKEGSKIFIAIGSGSNIAEKISRKSYCAQ